MSCPGFAVRVLVAFLSRSWLATPDHTAIGEWSPTPSPRCGRPKPSIARWISSPSPLTTTIRSRASSIWPSTCKHPRATLLGEQDCMSGCQALVVRPPQARGEKAELERLHFGVELHWQRTLIRITTAMDYDET